MHEFSELTRIIMFLLGAAGLVYLGTQQKTVTLAMYGIAFQFCVRAGLLFFQLNDYDDYAALNNALSTPSTVIAILLVYTNLFILRKE